MLRKRVTQKRKKRKPRRTVFLDPRGTPKLDKPLASVKRIKSIISNDPEIKLDGLIKILNKQGFDVNTIRAKYLLKREITNKKLIKDNSNAISRALFEINSSFKFPEKKFIEFKRQFSEKKLSALLRKYYKIKGPKKISLTAWLYKEISLLAVKFEKNGKI